MKDCANPTQFARAMTLSLILSTVKVPAGTPDESAVGIYEMLDVEEVLIPFPETTKQMDPGMVYSSVTMDRLGDSKPIDSDVKPALVPPPLLMGKIPTALESSRPVSQIPSQEMSSSSNIIIAEPKMRDLHKDLVTMIPSSVRRHGQALEHAPKKQKVTKEDEYQKFMSQFE